MKTTARNTDCLMRKFALLAAVLSLFLTGCISSRVTNLTTTRQPRNPAGVYPIEMAWDSNQQALIDGSVKPYVVIGFDQYPMRPALDIKNRFETVIPVGADKNYVVYHFKVDYEYRDFGKPSKSSRLSSSYRLDISDK